MRIKQHVLIGTLLLLGVLFSNSIKAQSATDLRFNEVLVLNDSLNVDDFGQHSSWIEIFNTGYNSVDIGGCFLSNDAANPTKYWIPTGSPSTLISPRCFILFWADAKPSQGIFHLNFELRNSKELYLYDASGRTLIDKLEINVPQESNKSFGKINEDSKEWVLLSDITPATSNDHSRKAAAGEKFVEMDPTGIGMTIIAMTVVFISLALLYLIFKATGNFFVRRANKPKVVAAEEKTVSKVQGAVDLSGEVSAAISMALHLYHSELHDEENTVLTIKKVARTYSPWSSKIYTLRKYPR